MKKFRLWSALFLGASAFAVMPDGPWYRQVGAAVLISLANELFGDK